MLRIDMDGAGDIPDDWLTNYDMEVVTINIHFANKIFLQGIALSNEEYFHIADTSEVIPKTSQPTPQQSLEATKELLQYTRQTIMINEVILSDLSVGIVAKLGAGTTGIVASGAIII